MWKKVVLLFLAVLFALALLPGGLASWSQGVEIRGKVHTGKWSKQEQATTKSVESIGEWAGGNLSPEPVTGSGGQNQPAPDSVSGSVYRN